MVPNVYVWNRFISNLVTMARKSSASLARDHCPAELGTPNREWCLVVGLVQSGSQVVDQEQAAPEVVRPRREHVVQVVAT